MIPVSVAISQAQWAWFDQKSTEPRPLYDLDVIDQASRGAWGSLILLWRFRFRHFVVLGALLVSISALTSPIIQLAINYPMRDVPLAREVASTHAIQDLSSPRDALGIVAHISTFLASFLDTTKFTEPIPYSVIANRGVFCSTGNCTFKPYHSIGVCMKMANITSSLNVDEFENPESPDLAEHTIHRWSGRGDSQQESLEGLPTWRLSYGSPEQSNNVHRPFDRKPHFWIQG